MNRSCNFFIAVLAKGTLPQRVLFYIIFSVGLTLQMWSSSYGQVRYTVIDVDTSAGSVVRALAINKFGHVVGYSQTGAFLYRNGVVTDLVTNGDARGISDSDDVIGYITSQHGYLYKNGTIIDLTNVLGAVGTGNAINGTGDIAGADSLGAFLYKGGIVTDLSAIVGPGGSAFGINDLDDVVGTASHADTCSCLYAYLYKSGAVTDLGTLGGSFTSPHAVNNADHVVGSSQILGNTTSHAFLYQDGNMVDLKTLNGTTFSIAYGINNKDIIVGTSSNRAFLYRNGVMTDLNLQIDSGSGWVLQVAYAINDSGQIVGYGAHNGQTHAFLLIPQIKLSITRPAMNELWIAGETDTIRWTSVGVDSVNILLSTNYQNGAGSFEELVHAYPADSAKYVWQIPDTTLSRKCAIQIENSAGQDPYAVSDPFKIKPYVLTRVDGNGDYEPYKIGPTIGEDDWIFNNTEQNIFPPSWYGQFDYVNGTDPFTHSHYTYDFQYWLVNAHPKDFPDWPSFVRAFGTDQCYFTLNFGGLLKPMAIFYWAAIKNSWGGSCFGFASSSFMAFDRKSDFISRFGMPQFGNLRDVQAGDTTRKVINEIFTYEYGTEGKVTDLSAVITRPNETLQKIKQMFRSEDGDNRHIDFFDYTSGSGHAVNPWKISTRSDHPELEYIQVYDNNYPEVDNLAIEVDTVQNTWSYPTIAPGTSKPATNVHLSSLTGTTHKSTGLVLSLPSSSFLHNANIPFTPSGARKVAAQSFLSIYNSSHASIKLTNSIGDSIVYHSKDSSLIVGIADAVPNIPLTSNANPPIGYDVPVDSYIISMSDFSDSLTYFSAFVNGQVIYAGRSDATNTQTDYLSFDTGLGTRNRDSNPKRTNFGSIIAELSLQKQIDVLNCTLVQNDSMRFAPLNNDGFQLLNAGTSKDYDINLRNVSVSGDLRFTHAHISLGANSTHFISPRWDSLSTTSLKILIDNGNDGITDDSIFVDNQVTGVNDRSVKGIPTEFALYQNYPNPFNPSTTISFDLPRQSYVTLKVYNVLGQEVATLVNGGRQAGRYSIPLEATEQPSGIYFYRLTAGSFSDVKKLIILK